MEFVWGKKKKEEKSFAAHVKLHKAFKVFYLESCCEFCKISKTRFQILVGGRDSDMRWFVLGLVLIGTVT